MFLSTLDDSQKRAYLNLAYKLIAADGVLDKREMDMLERYKTEMSFTFDLNSLNQDVDTAIEVFKNADKVVKKRVLFELMGLSYADDEQSDTEKAFLEQISAMFGISPSDLELCRVYVCEVMDVYKKIGRFIAD